MNLELLSAPFAPEQVSWRAQSVTERDGKHKALALAYIDARDVQDRLDLACDPENWQDSYVETPKGRIICTLQIRINGEWISKSDGAGDTDVEGDKGALSDALKRAAVKWGVGRYLYALKSPWVPCEVNQHGKFKKFTDDPWNHVKGASLRPQPVPAPKVDVITDDQRGELISLCEAAGVNSMTVCDTYGVKDFRDLTPAQYEAARKRLNLSIDKKIQQKEAA